MASLTDRQVAQKTPTPVHTQNPDDADPEALNPTPGNYVIDTYT